MSTRRVESGGRRRQNGWASAPEFDVLRGLNGTAVALKAALQDAPEKRELLYFLQALSLREGGLKRIARDLLAMFPERLGTRTMHACGCKPGMKLSAKNAALIEDELDPEGATRRAFDAHYLSSDDVGAKAAVPEPHRTAGELMETCRARAERLDDFIEELCCDPKMEVARPSDSRGNYRGVVQCVLDDVRDNLEDNSKLARSRPDLVSAVAPGNEFRAAEVAYFSDVLGALYEFQRRHAERVRAEFVETSMSQIVFEAFNYVLETGRTALVEGNSGYGKTTALRACYEMNLGRARYVQLSGINSRTAFLKRIADACGVANGGGMSSDRIQARVEAFLKRTRLVLLVDEAQYLWPQGKRITSHPELMNWMNTSLYNEGVPFLLSATRQFTLRRQAVEKQSDWSSEQSRRRTRKVFPLPAKPTTEDLRSVARKLLSDVGIAAETAVDRVVGYALVSKGYFQSVSDAIDDARLIARRAGRQEVTYKDLKSAIDDWRAPSDAALQRVFDTEPEPARRGRAVATGDLESTPPAAPIIAPLSTHSRGVNDDLRTIESGRRSVRPEAGPVLAG